MTIIRSIRANVYILILCNEVFLWNVNFEFQYQLHEKKKVTFGKQNCNVKNNERKVPYLFLDKYE